MNRKTALMCIFFAVLVMSTGFFIEPAKAQSSAQVVRIRSDGSVEPASVSIQRNGDTYLFTGDVYARGISIEKSGITIDGAGHNLFGPYNGTQSLWIIGNGPNQTLTNDAELWSIGIDTVANSINNLTIQNLNVKNFSIGMYVWTSGNMVVGNAITDGIVGILVAGADNSITSNYIANNKNGVYFGSNSPSYLPPNVTIAENRFVNNTRQLSGCVCIDYNLTEAKHYWDNGIRGNFWSDYNGTDTNGDGIGDTPYEIDPLNLDRYPLATSSVTPPTVTFDLHIVFAAGIVVAAVIIVAVFVVFRRNKKRTAPVSCENMKPAAP